MFERFTKDAKYAVVMAQEEARELHAHSIGVEHVLLGLLGAPDDELAQMLADNGLTAESVREALARKRGGEPLGAEDAEALRSIGIDLDAVRESLEASFGEDALDRALPEQSGRWGFFRGAKDRSWGHIPFTGEAKKVLELSLREALARKEKTIEAGHILLGILRAPNETTRRLLGGDAGVTRLRDATNAYLDRAA
ncbi:Clp protease N-terminal domain-containing protein [Nocardia huaxiensis]|uniref:Clp protease n=1 Tax=Nocardia huaxiensis TaxID=2755382 RepID=A0A7D6ZFE8_9NOCA|nr:Clp protease N-terminal domain-containing protein [Nocardia huaxiensis]QLY32298.1 Clp protease [Nocardia huaxiensis]UFS93997.1 Clp protease [Nocardia huaxiensis]